MGDALGQIDDTGSCRDSLLVNSNGMWAEGGNVLAFGVPLLLLQIAMIIFLTHLVHFPLSYLRVPKVVSQLITGVIIAPLFRNLDKGRQGTACGQGVEIRFFSVQSQEILGVLSSFGVVLYFFIWGVRMDIGLVRRMGKRSLVIGILAQVLPFAMGDLIAHLLNRIKLEPDQFGKHYMPLVEYSSMTAFPVVASFLGELKMTNSELGRHVLSSAIVCDAMGLIYYTGMMCYFTRPQIRSYIGTVLFVVLLVVVIRPVIKWVIKQTPEGRQVKDGYIATIIIGTFFIALIVRYFGQVLTMTPFAIGLVIPDGPPMGFAIIQKLNSLVSDMLMPVFISTSAMRVYLHGGLVTRAIVWADVGLIILIFSIKIISALIPAVLSRIPAKDAIMISLILCVRGTVEVAHYSIVKDRRVLDQDAYTIVIFATIFIASVLPNVIYFMYDPMRQYAGYNKRNLESLSPGQTPRMLVCVQKNDNVATFISFLSFSTPTMEHPIAISVIHLIEIYGRSAPLFISHHGGAARAESSFSHNVIDAFEQYKRRNPPGSVLFNAFTSVAPLGIMHNDIGTLAMNEGISLIVIPFHKKWTIGGKLEWEDNKLLALNRSILERAPSSVGIIVDRGSVRKVAEPPGAVVRVNVLMIFFGGCDDREALASVRFSASVCHEKFLTVIHFKAENEDEEECSEDREALKIIKEVQKHNPRVKFLEERVKDGPQTALVIRSIVDEYDLIVVGRRNGEECAQTSGLIEWSEFPELGAIGDLLASPDLETKTSTLVIQQQKMAGQKHK